MERSDSVRMVLAERMRLLREGDCRSKASMARQLGISPRLYSYYESGRVLFGLEFLCKLADYFDVTCDYIAGLSDDPKGYKCPELIQFFPANGLLKMV